MSWLKAIRLQFYPMSFIAYAVGAYGAEAIGFGFDKTIFWIGYLWLFFLEVATVLSNDYFDFRSDARNKYFSPFTGGSRVLVEKLLDFRQLKTAIIVSLAISFCALAAVLAITSISLTSIATVCSILFVLAIGYTVPPVKLSYRGLGELTVGITHSFALIICGYMFQGGSLMDNFSWSLGLPLFLGVLPSIILAGVPDRDADSAVSKRTMAVRFGKRGAARLAIFFTILAAATVTIFNISGIFPDAFRGILIPVIPHAILLVYLLSKYINKNDPPDRIDGLLVAALTYIFWFGVIPLINLA
jgi:1,4-dihydroxy-2-naphthoate octaprenyltransferase